MRLSRTPCARPPTTPWSRSSVEVAVPVAAADRQARHEVVEHEVMEDDDPRRRRASTIQECASGCSRRGRASRPPRRRLPPRGRRVDPPTGRGEERCSRRRPTLPQAASARSRASDLTAASRVPGPQVTLARDRLAGPAVGGRLLTQCSRNQPSGINLVGVRYHDGAGCPRPAYDCRAAAGSVVHEHRRLGEGTLFREDDRQSVTARSRRRGPALRSREFLVGERPVKRARPSRPRSCASCSSRWRCEPPRR
jgi:hypothetical protein